MQPSPLPLSPASFRQVLGSFATGVAIVTTRSGDTIHGLTANAFCSVSMEPMLVLVCVDKQAYSHDLMLASQNFGINILAAEHQPHAERFANNDLEAPQRYAGLAYHTVLTGAPIFDEAMAWVDCELYATHEGGDHTIIVGKVVALGKGESQDPLLYYQSRYHTMQAPPHQE